MFLDAQVQEPSRLHLNALQSQADQAARKSFVVFFGRHDFNLVSSAKVVSFEEGLRKMKKSAPLLAAVQEAGDHIKARLAAPESADAQIWC